MPGLAAERRKSGRVYPWGDEEFYSVTTILQTLHKPAIAPWAAREVAEYVSKNLEKIAPLLEDNQEKEAIDLMKGAPWRKRDKAADLGTAIHQYIETMVTGQPVFVQPTSPPVIAAMDLFDNFLSKFQPTIIESEVTIFNRKFDYAGTLDLIVEMLGKLWVLDLKTGSGVYPEFALQVCAYSRGEFIGRADGTEAPMPKTEAGGVLHIRPEGYRLIPVRIDEQVFNSFLYIREAFRWVEEIAHTALLTEVRM